MTVEEIRGQQLIMLCLNNHIQVTCCRSGHLLSRCARPVLLLKHFIPLIFSSLSWLYTYSMFPAQPPPHTAARITPAKCICRHSYKVGPQLPFRHLEYDPCLFPPQPQTHPFLCAYVSLCFWKSNASEGITSSISGTTTGPPLLTVHSQRHLNDSQ